MQPTENKQPTQEELIAHIRKTLKAHDEPYNLGAWESFNTKQQANKTPLFWITRLGSVAAVIAICFALFLFNRTKTIQQQEIVKVNKIQELPQESSNSDLLIPKSIPEFEKNNFAATDKKSSSQFSVTNHQNIINQIKDKNALADNNSLNAQLGNQIVNPAQDKEVKNEDKNQVIAAVAEEKTNAPVINIDDQYAQSTPARITKNNHKSKWVLGLMVAPSVGNAEEINMGYGLSMAYNFSNKLSLITGVAYNEMSASKDFKSSIGASSILYGNNKSLAAISQKVSGLDIPLELKYSFSKNVYASAGVSAFAVIGQSRSNTFIQGIVVNGTPNKGTSASASADQSGAKGQFANTYILNKKIVERAILEDQNDANFLGFYNFSVGYKRMMLKRHFVAFEPFVKLPIKSGSQDDLRLVGAGLRLKVDF